MVLDSSVPGMWLWNVSVVIAVELCKLSAIVHY